MADNHTQNKRIPPKKRRRKRRHLRGFLLSLFFFFLLAGVFLTLSLTVFFKIDTAEYIGPEGRTEEEILEAAAVPVGKNLFLSNMADIRDRVEKAYPDIGEIVVKRKLPGTVSIQNNGYGGLVQYRSGGQHVVVNGDGEIIRILPEPLSGVTVITGVSVQNPALHKRAAMDSESRSVMTLEVKKEAERLELGPITEIGVDELGSVAAMYEGRIKLIIGTAARLEDKLRTAKLILSGEDVPAGVTGEIDLSVSGNAYLRITGKTNG